MHDTRVLTPAWKRLIPGLLLDQKIAMMENLMTAISAGDRTRMELLDHPQVTFVLRACLRSVVDGQSHDAEAGLNSTKRIYRQRSRLFAYLKQTFGHHSATFDYLATGEMPALSPTGWEEECAVGSAFAEPYSIGLQANSELRSIAAAVP